MVACVSQERVDTDGASQNLAAVRVSIILLALLTDPEVILEFL